MTLGGEADLDGPVIATTTRLTVVDSREVCGPVPACSRKMGGHAQVHVDNTVFTVVLGVGTDALVVAQ